MQTQQQNLLLIEKKTKKVLCFYDALVRKGYSILKVDNGNDGLIGLNDFEPDVVIINAASMRTNGLRIASWYHNRLPNIPIFLIVAEDAAITEAEGVDMILQLPFTVQKLVNRLKAFKRTANQGILTRENLQLNPKTRMVIYGDKSTVLTPRLSMLLKAFLENPGKELKREDLFKQVWETDYTVDTRTLDVHISWLRKTLEDDPTNPKLIKTIRGVGYILDL